MAPTTMQALKSISAGKAEVQSVPAPQLRDTYLLVKTHAVALNPTDWKHVDKMPTAGATVGCDFSGVVSAIGSGVTKRWAAGDRVIAFAHGVNAVEPEDGAFAQYALTKGDLALRLPDGVGFEDGATLALGAYTVGQGVFQSLGLPLPGAGDAAGEWLLVYGGSTATGSLAIQLARAAGARVVSVNSPHNDEFVRSLGAEAAFDYKDPEVGKKIREHTGDAMRKAFDCISEGQSGKICGEALSTKGGKATFLLAGVDAGREDVDSERILMYTVTGERFTIAGHEFPANPENFEFAKKFAPVVEKLLAEGKLKVHPPEVKQGGLEGVLGGLDELRQGKVSGKKLVYSIA